MTQLSAKLKTGEKKMKCSPPTTGIHCGQCAKKCPYGLKPYETLPGQLAFYREFLKTHGVETIE